MTGRGSAPPVSIMRKAIRHLQAADPVMGGIIQRVGAYRIQFREPGFETLVKSIVNQQLSGRVAQVIFGRLAAAVPGGVLTPERPGATAGKMRKLGLSKQKTAYIRDLARQRGRRHRLRRALPALPDAEVIERLTKVKGVGVWTAHMFLIFALRRTNVLPSRRPGDSGGHSQSLRPCGAAQTGGNRSHGARWHPYCTVAAWYLWRSLEPNANL